MYIMSDTWVRFLLHVSFIIYWYIFPKYDYDVAIQRLSYEFRFL